MPNSVSPTPPQIGVTRSPLATWLLSIATLGVYAVVHHHAINRELRDFGVEVRPVGSVLALVPGGVVLVPALVTLWHTAERIAVAQETVGLAPTARGRWGALAFIGLAFTAYHQSELNRVWDAERRSGPA